MMRLLPGFTLAFGACTSASQNADEAPVTGTIRLDLPPGFVGTLDDLKETIEPGVDHAVLAGEHTVVVQTPCGEHRAQVSVSAGALSTLAQGDFDGLAFAKLIIAATDLQQEPLLPTVTLDDWAVVGHASAATAVPACKARLRVSAPDLGAFVEDVDFKEGDEVRRAVVLAPGSDVVRIHGGTLTFRDWRLFPETKDDYGIPVGPNNDMFGSYEHTLATFDIDQREVTTAEFHACHLAGACVSTFEKFRKTEHPHDREGHHCTTDVIKDLRPPVTGKEDIAMNCVATWEAEEYCRWVGKRLPTVEEWEFAARSRGDDARWPDEFRTCIDSYNEDTLCPRRTQKAPASPCADAADVTAQGLCGMFSNLSELVTETPRSWPGTRAAGWGYASWGYPWGHDPKPSSLPVGGRQSPSVGFRCARDAASIENVSEGAVH